MQLDRLLARLPLRDLGDKPPDVQKAFSDPVMRIAPGHVIRSLSERAIAILGKPHRWLGHSPMPQEQRCDHDVLLHVLLGQLDVGYPEKDHLQRSRRLFWVKLKFRIQKIGIRSGLEEVPDFTGIGGGYGVHQEIPELCRVHLAQEEGWRGIIPAVERVFFD